MSHATDDHWQLDIAHGTSGFNCLNIGCHESRCHRQALGGSGQFYRQFLFLEIKPPAPIIGFIRNNEMVVRGYGEIAKGSGQAPDGESMRIGSITKSFAGAALASMVADGKVSFTDRFQDRLGWDVTVPELDGKSIRLIDLGTHTSGLPRESEIWSPSPKTRTASPPRKTT